jgi:hypothetical protein
VDVDNERIEAIFPEPLRVIDADDFAAPSFQLMGVVHEGRERFAVTLNGTAIPLHVLPNGHSVLRGYLLVR